MSAAAPTDSYPARFDVAYTDGRDRLSVLLRIFLIIPASIIYSLISGAMQSLSFAIVLMLLFRRRYPQPWFDWYLYLSQFGNRVWAYGALLVDEYPSTTDQQSVTTEADLDEARLNRWLPLVKWLLAIPHYIVLILLVALGVLVVVLAWFIILITGRYPRGLFNYVTGVIRWGWRVTAYAFLLSTDRYPPFSLR
jgi:hypothetical protein